MAYWKCKFCGKTVETNGEKKPFDSNNLISYGEYLPTDKDYCGNGHYRLDDPKSYTSFHWYERDAEREAERKAREAKEATEKLRQAEEQNKRDYERALDDLQKEKQKANTSQTSTSFENLKETFSQIVRVLQSLPGSFEVQAQIEECKVYQKQCEEKMNLYKKEETLSWFNNAKARIQNVRTAEQYDDLTIDFLNIEQNFKSLPSSFGVQAQIDECENYRRQCEDKWRAKQHRKEKFATFGVILQLGVTAVYLFILWGTDIVNSLWLAGGFSRLLPLAAFSVMVGIISIIFLRRVDYVSGPWILMVMILIQAITASVWTGNVGFLFINLIGRGVLNFISTILGLILVSQEGGKTK